MSFPFPTPRSFSPLYVRFGGAVWSGEPVGNDMTPVNAGPSVPWCFRSTSPPSVPRNEVRRVEKVGGSSLLPVERPLGSGMVWFLALLSSSPPFSTSPPEGSRIRRRRGEEESVESRRTETPRRREGWKSDKIRPTFPSSFTHLVTLSPRMNLAHSLHFIHFGSSFVSVGRLVPHPSALTSGPFSYRRNRAPPLLGPSGLPCFASDPSGPLRGDVRGEWKTVNEPSHITRSGEKERIPFIICHSIRSDPQLPPVPSEWNVVNREGKNRDKDAICISKKRSDLQDSLDQGSNCQLEKVGLYFQDCFHVTHSTITCLISQDGNNQALQTVHLLIILLVVTFASFHSAHKWW